MNAASPLPTSFRRRDAAEKAADGIRLARFAHQMAFAQNSGLTCAILPAARVSAFPLCRASSCAVSRFAFSFQCASSGLAHAVCSSCKSASGRSDPTTGGAFRPCPFFVESVSIGRFDCPDDFVICEGGDRRTCHSCERHIYGRRAGASVRSARAPIRQDRHAKAENTATTSVR